MIIGLDTCILSAFINNDKKNLTRREQLLQFTKDNKVKIVLIPTIVLAEIYCWAKQTEIEDMKEKLLKAVQIEIIDFDALCAIEQKHFNGKIDLTKSRQANMCLL